MKAKFIGYGALIGLFVGVAFPFLFPDLLLKLSTGLATGYGFSNASNFVTFGSSYNFLPGVFAATILLGGTLGYLVYLIAPKKSRRK